MFLFFNVVHTVVQMAMFNGTDAMFIAKKTRSVCFFTSFPKRILMCRSGQVKFGQVRSENVVPTVLWPQSADDEDTYFDMKNWLVAAGCSYISRPGTPRSASGSQREPKRDIVHGADGYFNVQQP